jgi:iron-sulfur cluster assembly protein
MVQPIDFSGEALCAFKRQLEKRPAVAIRLGVRGGACSGLQYVIEFDDLGPQHHDAAWSEGGVTFLVDLKSLAYLRGTRVTWSKTMMKEGFDFENPNEQSRCGCGKSFAAK